ncbi:MAG TPA: efflux RND transporter periplasmic adaptor subunit [Patescibacteria group bacterium]|nr:efflux RND transporter periplasmic adaptor subunit [Patescibacteria group bacterium]
MKKNRILIGLIIASMSLGIGCSSQTAKNAANVETEKPITVEVAKATQGQIESMVSYSGRIKPIQEIIITPKQPGKVTKINFEVGQEVKADEILFELDDTDALLQVSQAAASVELAEINLKKLSGSTYEQQIAQLKSAVVSTEINFKDAKTNYESMKSLYEIGAESKLNFDRAESQYKLAEQQYQTAKINYDITEQVSASENIAAARAQLNQSKVAYQMAKNALENTRIKSPINGVVAAKNVKVGEYISNAAASYIVIDHSSYTVDLDVNEDVIGKVVIGDQTKVYINSISEEALSGTIIAAAPSADMKKQTYLVKIAIDNPPSTIKGGMFAEVKLILNKVENCVLVPLTSLTEEAGKKYIFLLKGDRAAKTEVTAGMFNDKEIQIIKGISVDDTIVIKGQDFLKDGSTVVVSGN